MADIRRPIIALLTDFGTHDAYVGIMKTVIEREAPDITCIDVTHDVPAFSLLPGAYLAYAAWRELPPGGVLLCVIDPGVGSTRRELIAQSGGRTFVGPDNGLISLIARMTGPPPLRAHRAKQSLLDELRGRRDPWSATFDGRDLFSPVAARAAAAGTAGLVGEPAAPLLLPAVSNRVEPADHDATGRGVRRRIVGTILHIDHFGSCVTSVHRTELPDPRRLRVAILSPSGDARVDLGGLSRTYSDVAVGEPLAYLGSAGFVEIAVRNASAALRYGVSVGDAALIEVDPA
jgi:S-adenosyl-L-methionine hydrolase (adenosine-forming)